MQSGAAKQIREKTRFQLSSEECELLLLFEINKNLPGVAEAMGRDHSVVARQLKKIGDRFPVVEKKAGKWILTEAGKALNEASRSAIRIQNATLTVQQSLRIGTNREFAARVLGEDFINFQKLFSNIELSIHTYQNGTEAALLSREIDLGIDCDRPQDPDIAFKLVANEEIVCVVGKNFLKQWKKNSSGKDISACLHELPHLFCDRLHPDRIAMNIESKTQIFARFNDIATTRAVCKQGMGWALLPYYAVCKELEEGSLVVIQKNPYGNSKYGVWWLRSRPYLKDSCEKICAWLLEQKLSAEKCPKLQKLGDKL